MTLNLDDIRPFWLT